MKRKQDSHDKGLLRWDRLCHRWEFLYVCFTAENRINPIKAKWQRGFSLENILPRALSCTVYCFDVLEASNPGWNFQSKKWVSAQLGRIQKMGEGIFRQRSQPCSRDLQNNYKQERQKEKTNHQEQNRTPRPKDTRWAKIRKSNRCHRNAFSRGKWLAGETVSGHSTESLYTSKSVQHPQPPYAFQ